ncbi:MAG: DUF5706 domain-containing protein [Chloroherpetonaceae bacterium]|nr:DUF5706 domain-containing protein [Chloroherpetonaceae bacterium]
MSIEISEKPHLSLQSPFYSPLLLEAESYVYQNYKEKLQPNRVYHNFSHTVQVVKASSEIGIGEGLNEDELEILLLAAWFHDLGHIETYENHERKSAEFAEQFLLQKGYAPEKITRVTGAIYATVIPQNPKTFLDEILCDADLIHLGLPNYETSSELLRAEWELVQGNQYSDLKWLEGNIVFFELNPFRTKYCLSNYADGRSENYLQLRKRFRRIQLEEEQLNSKKKDKKKKDDDSVEKVMDSEPLKQVDKSTQKPSEKVSDREFDSVYKTTSRNNVDFSQIADQKANLLIQVNATIISIFIAVFIRRLEEQPQFIPATLILLMVCVITIIFAILSTRPNVTFSKDKPDELLKKRTNLLFFGNYLHLSLNEYERGIDSMTNDKEYLHDSMIKDNYYLGMVLGQKYRYLRVSYNFFMYGLVISVLAFIITFAIKP